MRLPVEGPLSRAGNWTVAALEKDEGDAVGEGPALHRLVTGAELRSRISRAISAIAVSFGRPAAIPILQRSTGAAAAATPIANDATVGAIPAVPRSAHPG